MADSVDELFPEPQMTDEVVEEPQHVEEPAEVVEPTPEAEVAPEPEPEPEPVKQETQHGIPIPVALDWRDKAKEYKRRLDEIEARQAQQSQSHIDPLDDPAGFAAQQQALVQQAIVADRFERSNEDAIEKFGEEKVSTAVQWAAEKAQTNPAFAAEYMSKPRPIHWIVQQHQRDAMLSEIGDNPDDYFAREAAKRGYVLQSAPVAAPVAAAPTPAPAPARVPRSLASQGTAPSDVRQTATGPLAGVDALFS